MLADMPEYNSIIRKEWTSERIDSVNMAMLEEAAEKLLNEDEFKAVKRHIKSVTTCFIIRHLLHH